MSKTDNKILPEWDSTVLKAKALRTRSLVVKGNRAPEQRPLSQTYNQKLARLPMPRLTQAGPGRGPHQGDLRP
jgi:hypothetical protein